MLGAARAAATCQLLPRFPISADLRAAICNLVNEDEKAARSARAPRSQSHRARARRTVTAPRDADLTYAALPLRRQIARVQIILSRTL